MLSIHTLRLKDYATFKDVEFKVTPGITYIYGLNRVSGKGSKNRNGVGKSALVGAIPEIVHEDPIIGSKMDRTSGHKWLAYTDNRGREVQIARVPKGRGERIQISVEGKELKLRTPTYAKSAIRKLFPLTGEDYRTYVHIDSRIPHPLVMGNSAERQRFLTRFFGLDKLDMERKLYTAELAKLKRTRAAFNELRAQYDKTKTNLLSDEELEIQKKRARKYEARVEALQAKISKVQNVLRLMEFATASASEIMALQECLPEVTAEEFDAHEKDEKLNLKDAEAKLKDAEAWAQYKKERRSFDEAYSKLSGTTQKLLAKYGLTRLRRLASSKSDIKRQAESEVLVARTKLKKIKEQLLRELPAKVKAPEEDIGDLETLRRAYKHQLEHATKFKSGTCETCGQIVKIKNPKSLRAKLESVIEKLNAHKRAQAYSAAVEARAEAEKEFKSWTSRLVTEKATVAKYAKWENVFNEVRDLPPEPEPFKGLKLEVEVCRQMVDEIKDKLALLKYMRPHLDTVIEFLSLSKEEVKAARAAQGLEAQMAEAQERWNKARTAISVHETFKAQVGEMRARLKDLKAKLEDEPALQHLVKAYQNKNMKKMAIEAIAERLMVLINRFAQQVMPEAFVFEFKYDTQIRFLVHRRNGKTSDVRKLSGAESTFYTLVLVCALLGFVPDRKRVNLLILDEPAARLSDELKEAFKHLVKVLNTLIPSIIIITPHQEVHQGARCVTVVKDRRGVSTLVEAHPLTIK